LLQGRFKSILVEKERHLLELVRYIVLNPVRAGVTRTAAEWRWSNYRATAGLTSPPQWLDVNWTLVQFGDGDRARNLYRRFVAAGRYSGYAPWEELTGQIFLGGKAFRTKLQNLIDGAPPSREIPRPQRSPLRPTLEAIIAATAMVFDVGRTELRRPRKTLFRIAVAYLARNDAGLRFADFADVLGVQPWAASNLAGIGGKLLKRSDELREKIDRIRVEIHNSQT
jgi:hypothetical protein